MKRLALAIGVSVIAAACSSSSPAGPGPIAAGGTSTAAVKPSTGVPRNWVAHITGDSEVPANASKGQGQVVFQLNAAGDEISYRLISSNINNVVQSHIHLAPVGVNGNIVVFLFGPVSAAGGPHDGVLATGTIRAANLINDLVGQPLSALIERMDSGGAYVNVHTNDGVAPGNTGPGDLGAGEIRGQIQPAGHEGE